MAGRLNGRVAVITGASRGIGRAVAVRFAQEGAQLVLLGRAQAALEETDDAVRAVGGSASLVVADLRDYAVIDQVGAAIFERWGRLDALVGNAAALGVLSPLSHVDPAVWEEVVAVNLTANWRLIRSFDPLLRAAPAGRAVFVSSEVASGYAYWGPFAASKGALESLARTYAHEVARTSVRANLIDPGPTRTRMRAQAFPGEDPNSLKPADDAALMDAFVSLCEDGCARNGDLIRL